MAGVFNAGAATAAVQSLLTMGSPFQLPSFNSSYLVNIDRIVEIWTTDSVAARFICAAAGRCR